MVDTGALLALLDADDRWHRACVEAFQAVRLPLATSAAVLAELFHLIGRHPHDQAAAWRLIRSGAVTILGVTDEDLPSLASLMERYSDRPMDFADATLIHLARREGLSAILTIDPSDFETYRIEGRRRFRITPSRMT